MQSLGFTSNLPLHKSVADRFRLSIAVLCIHTFAQEIEQGIADTKQRRNVIVAAGRFQDYWGGFDMEAVVGFQTGHSCLGRHCMERWEVTSHTRRRKWIILCSRLAPPRLELATVSFYNSITAVNRCFGVVPHHHSTVAISTFACLVAHIRSTDMISARTVARIDICNHQGCPCTRRKIFIPQGSRGPRCEWSFDLLLSIAFC